MQYLENFFKYIRSGRISRREKLLLFVCAAVYVVSPVDLLPFNPLDDIGVAGAVMAYINWRVKRIKDAPQDVQESAANTVIDAEIVEDSSFFSGKKS